MLLEVPDPKADGVTVHIEKVSQLADSMALAAELDGVGTAADGKVGMASVGVFKLVPLGFGQPPDKSQ